MTKYKRTEWTGYYDHNLEKICVGDILISMFDGEKYTPVLDKRNKWNFKNIDNDKIWRPDAAEVNYVIICREFLEEEE